MESDDEYFYVAGIRPGGSYIMRNYNGLERVMYIPKGTSYPYKTINKDREFYYSLWELKTSHICYLVIHKIL